MRTIIIEKGDRLTIYRNDADFFMVKLPSGKIERTTVVWIECDGNVR